ncbi:hypothetical protein PFISCL1PPCAC_17722, partial [Pristionchus fissidentatus]
IRVHPPDGPRIHSVQGSHRVASSLQGILHQIQGHVRRGAWRGSDSSRARCAFDCRRRGEPQRELRRFVRRGRGRVWRVVAGQRIRYPSLPPHLA